jgi:hypothetical protein
MIRKMKLQIIIRSIKITKAICRESMASCLRVRGTENHILSQLRLRRSVWGWERLSPPYSMKGQRCLATAQIIFNVIEPSSVTQVPYPGYGTLHIFNRPTGGMYTQIYIGPDNVNFYKVSFKEMDVAAICSCPGAFCWDSGNGHGPGGALPLTDTVVAGLGTFAGAGVSDECWSGYDPTVPPAPTAVPGTEIYNIPWLFAVGSQPFAAITTVVQKCELAADGISLTVSKATATMSCKIGDPNYFPARP